MRIFISVFFFVSAVTELRAQSDDNIVIVDVGLSNRGEIAGLISKIYSRNPRIIAIAFQFSEVKPSIKGDDQLLRKALEECSRKLVLPAVMEKKKLKNGETSKSFKGNDPSLMPFGVRIGFINIEEIGKDSVPNLRYFQAYDEIRKNSFGGITIKTVYQFGVRTAMLYDSMKTINFVRRNHRIIELYKSGRRAFTKYSYQDVFNGRAKLTDIEGKIVLVGFMGPGNANKFFSPWNKTRLNPDIYGVEYQAQIVAEVLGSK